MGELIELNFNAKKARQTIILFISSSLFLFFLLFITDNKLSVMFEEFREIFILLFLSYSVFVFNLSKRFYISYINSPKIIVNDNEILIPTFYLGIKRIITNELYSIEKLKVKNKEVGICLGMRNKGSYILDKERFENSDEFKWLSEYLASLVEKSNSVEINKTISEISLKQNNNPLIFSYIVSVLAVFFYFIGTGGGFEYSGSISFLEIGANTKSIINNLEIYRIASSTFLHISIFHLLLNLLMLGIFSQFMEKALGYVRFSNLFLLSSTVAVLMSAWFSNFDASIGASGGIFGLWGAYTVLKINYEDSLPGSINSIPTKKFYFVLFVEIFIEVFLIENIDYMNHLGGFVAGFAYLYFAPLGPKLEYVDQPTVFEKYLFVGLVLAFTIGLSYFLLLYYGLI